LGALGKNTTKQMTEYKHEPRTADLACVVNIKPIDKCNLVIRSIIEKQRDIGYSWEAANLYHAIPVLDWKKGIHINTSGTSIVNDILEKYPNINVYRHKTLIGESFEKSMLRNKIVAALIGRLGLVQYSFWGIMRLKAAWLINPIEKILLLFFDINYSRLQFCSEFWIRAARLFTQVCTRLSAEEFLPATPHDSGEFILVAKYRDGKRIK